MRNFFLSVSLIVSVQVRIFLLNMRHIIIYVARWWKKYLSKRSLIKHNCSWRVNLLYYNILASQKLPSSIFLGLIGLNKQKIKNHLKPSNVVLQLFFPSNFSKSLFLFILHWKFNPFAPFNPLTIPTYIRTAISQKQ